VAEGDFEVLGRLENFTSLCWSRGIEYCMMMRKVVVVDARQRRYAKKVYRGGKIRKKQISIQLARCYVQK